MPTKLQRVLKINGIAILQVPIKNELDKTIDGRNIEDPKMRNEMFGQYDHLRTYGKDFFEKVEKHGFKVQREGYCDNLSDHQIKKYGLIKDEIIPVCIKV